MRGALSPDTRSQLWLPRPALSGCVRALMGRDTRGAVLSDAQRFNHFPATPLCSVTWWFHGEAQLLPPGAPASLAGPRTHLPSTPLFGGAATGPTLSWNPGPSHALVLLLLPDALHRLTGLRVQDWVNRWDQAHRVLPPDWLGLLDAVAHAADDTQRVALLQDFLQPRWAEVRPAWPMQAHRYVDWAQSLALHAATSGPGKSLRQVERRFKRWAGLPMREVRGLSRAEQLFFSTLAAGSQGQPNWAELADANGYADQSHLCRETRRVTGFPPQELYQRIQDDEGFWPYRLWA